MTYKYDPHMHTSEASACAHSTAREMADKYKAEGYTGIFVTNHYFNGNTSVHRDIPWKERVERYCLGYELAKKRGEEIGLDVFFGFEYGNGQSDLLTYGLSGRWLYEHPEILDMTPADYIRFVHGFGGFVVHAHPFREADYIASYTLVPRFEDAVETVNASNCEKKYNDHAKTYASWFGLPETGGSDSHDTSRRFYKGGIETDHKLTSVEDYIDAVRNRKILRIIDNDG